MYPSMTYLGTRVATTSVVVGLGDVTSWKELVPIGGSAERFFHSILTPLA